MKVKKRTLLLIACFVWGIAGFNVLRIGILAYPPYLSPVNFLLSGIVFAVFQYFIFGHLVKKHTKRIESYEDHEFRYMWLTIVLSFGFYIPVVLWADQIPMIGMLMIPKTCAYVWTVLIGYQAMKHNH